MRLLNGTKGIFAAALVAIIAGAACRTAEEVNVNVNANAGSVNATVNVNSANSANMSGSTVTTSTGQTIEAREPDKYSATVVVAASTAGQQQRAAGQTEIKVARSGADRRYALDTKLPGVGEIIFLDKADKRYLILPAQKKYAELTQELTGMNMDAVRSMTPGQLVAFVSRQQGVERVGEETLNTRAVTKYRVAGRTQTQSSAGQVQGETFIYVDKETGLPLRVEGFGQSSGNVSGVSGGNLVAEMKELKTDVDPTQFEIPQGYAKITSEEVRQQMAQMTQIVQGIMGFINSQQKGAPAPASSPAGSPVR